MKDRAVQVAVLSLCLLPLLWLWPSVFGGRTFVPYDVAEFPPASLLLTPEQYEATRDGANHDVTELPPWFVPEMKLAGDELRSGRLPTWNPNARTGAPLHAHGLIGLCYPPNWIALCADDPASRLVILAWISLALGGLFAFGLLRCVGLPVLPAWFGAMLFQLSGPMAVNSFFWMRLASYVWLPGVLWALLCLARADRMRPRPLCAVAVSFAMTWLGGFPPFAITTSTFAGFLVLWLVGERLYAGTRAEAARLGLRLGCGLLLGAMLAMPQVLPSMQFFAHSARTTDPELAEIAGSAFETHGLLGYLVPDLVSHPSLQSETPYAIAPMALLLNTRCRADGSPAETNYNYTEYAVFVGTLGFLLACAGALRGRGRLRAFAITAFVLSMGLALFLPGVNLLFLLPVIKNVAPMRWLAPATLVVAWLAALGFDRLRETTRRLPLALAGAALGLAGLVVFVTSRPAADPTAAVQRIADRFGLTAQQVVDHVHRDRPGFDRFARAFERARTEGREAATWLAIVGTLLAGLALARSTALRHGVLLAGSGLTVLQLAWHGGTVTRGVLLAQTTNTDVHAFLRERAREAAPEGGFAIVRASFEPMLPVQLPPGQLMVPGIRDLHFYTHYDAHSAEPIRELLGTTSGRKLGEQTAAKGYLTLSLPDALPTPSEREDAARGEAVATYSFASPLEHPLLDLLGVRYVLATEPLTHAGKRVGPELRGPRVEFFVFERPHPLPRAFTVNELRVLPTDAEVLRALVDPGLQPRAAACALAADLADPAPARASDAAQRPVRFVSDLATAVELDVGAGNAPWLVLADTLLPGWVATIGGVETPILRVNHSQRAVRLPAGPCRVRFAYTCPGLRMGTMLAGIATAVLLAAALYGRHCSRATRALDSQALM